MDGTKKVLLMGKAKAGKSSMRSIIFANYLARDSSKLGPTLRVETSTLRFLGDLQLNLWDCGGQDTMMDNYFMTQKNFIFRNVSVLIYVFDVESLTKTGSLKTGLSQDLHYYQKTIDAIHELSPDAKVFCLIHKIDLIDVNKRDTVFKEVHEELLHIKDDICDAFMTSIWDETLYKAWSSIVCELISNGQSLNQGLGKLMHICSADEIVLFERATFLVVAKATTNRNWNDVHRYEKISNIVKQFKLRCLPTRSRFQSMTVANSGFTAYLGGFTQSTNILVVLSDKRLTAEAVKINIARSKEYFENLLDQAYTWSSAERPEKKEADKPPPISFLN